MSHGKVPWVQLPPTGDELACIYSALILVDDDIPVTAEKIVTLLKAADLHVEPVWPTLFARALQGINVRQLVASSVMTTRGDVISGGAGAVTTAGDSASPQEEKKEETKKVEEEEDSSDEDLGLGLFD